MRRAAHGIAHALRRPSSSFPVHLETSCLLVPPVRLHSVASTSATTSSTRGMFKGVDVSCVGRGGCSVLVRRNMSSDLGGGGDVAAPNRYKEKEAMIREAQKMVRQLYKEGFYQDALEVTQRLVDMTNDLFGRKHGVYASALNDQALMLKSIGELAAATDTYLKALEVYRAAYKGEENISFAATLHNLGMTFKAMSEQGNSLERVPLLERAEETFQRCVEIREKILPNNHPDLQLARSRLAMVQGKLGGSGKERTEARLRAALDGLVVGVGKEDLSTATAMTNLALFLKLEGKFDEAQELYTTVVYTRKKLLGDSHMDTIVAMYNLAELHRAAGRETLAYKIQDDIIAIGEKVEAERLAQEAEAAASECATTQEGATGDRAVKEAIKRVGEAVHATQTAGDDEVVVSTWTPEGGTEKKES